MSPPDLIALGVIRKAHGVRGEASVEVWADDPARLEQFPSVFLVSGDEVRQVEVESVRYHTGRVLMKFAGFDSPESVRELQNWTIEIPASEARPLEDDEYFLHDLEGLEVFSGSERIGVIETAEEGGGGRAAERA